MTSRRQTSGTASYVFRVRFRLEPGPPEVSVEPQEFETVLYREADRPGSEGWLFFRTTSGAATWATSPTFANSPRKRWTSR